MTKVLRIQTFVTDDISKHTKKLQYALSNLAIH